MAEPIWKDYYQSLGTGDAYTYRIVAGGSSIYQGRAVKRPGETYNRIRLNEVCADWLSGSLPNLSSATFTALENAGFPVTFTVQTLSGNSWVNVGTVDFLLDWSYDYNYAVASDGLAFPINGHFDMRMWVPYTAYNAASVTMTIHYTDGTTNTVTVPIAISADFSNDFNTDFARSVRSAGSGTAIFSLAQYSNVSYITIGAATYKVVGDCDHRYALYYRNAYGGYDAFLPEGTWKMQDAVSARTYDRDYDNTDIQNRGTVHYLSDIRKSVILNSGWLSEDESSRMWHLLESTEVFLYDMVLAEMIPVTMQVTSVDHKTFKNNGRTAINYEMTVTYALDRIRR